VTDLADHLEAEPAGVDPLDDPLPPGSDLAVIGGLVDDVTVSGGRDGSTVRMSWPAADAAHGGPESPALGSAAPPA
jgi:hypothetical protein